MNEGVGKKTCKLNLERVLDYKLGVGVVEDVSSRIEDDNRRSLRNHGLFSKFEYLSGFEQQFETHGYIFPSFGISRKCAIDRRFYCCKLSKQSCSVLRPSLCIFKTSQ
mmetsp:Transcript_33601/g.77516  ORF Transcript_33601/g.77516 Transcript_33601/m.77516 type:complete len:108 (-) Transcript_33601:100-423(-)